MQHKTGGHHFEGVFLTKPCWQLAGQINCKLQQGMKKPLKPLQFQGFLDKGGKIDLPDRCSILFLRPRQTRQ